MMPCSPKNVLFSFLQQHLSSRQSCQHGKMADMEQQNTSRFNIFSNLNIENAKIVAFVISIVLVIHHSINFSNSSK